MSISPVPLKLPALMLWEPLNAAASSVVPSTPVLLLEVLEGTTDVTGWRVHVWVVLRDDGRLERVKCHPDRLQILVGEGYTTVATCGVTLLAHQDGSG